MSNYMKFCSCKQCKHSLRTKAGSKIMKCITRKLRRTARAELRHHQIPDTVVSVYYNS